ncbi:fatty acid oxidation complex subunit alpha FadJ [Paraferrimonas sedimenticola]|uniref:enoyl-CoA hydratase n=1 Tax=Paraferrimonas sedimenticola TaxID=375674 RepID=A0AA37VXI3_9GAMM|nr:fatty acid oxidation complex subunit alpha FadJ [Paraferrimonas sedimenticola]GLP96594.1 fatty acid oxidation complex subunit alpha [Paraferrimonas sedimenticola]
MTEEVKPSSFSLEVREDGIALLKMDVVGETMNTLRSEFAQEFDEILAQLNADSRVRGLVLYSGKDTSFVAGADVHMLDECDTAEQAQAIAAEGQRIFDQIENLRIPVVAAIHGVALGGGLELALACHRRVCSDSPKTLLGVPEVQLGLLPGSGGTQRLPALVGVSKALDMMLTGKQVRPKQALKMGLVDEMVPQSILLDAAIELAQDRAWSRPKRKQDAVTKVLEATPVGRNIIFDQAGKQVFKKTQGNYPAPERIIDSVRTGLRRGRKAGLEAEARHFGELVMTPESQALRSIFFATTEMKKESGAGDVVAEPVNKAVVLGGGLMGGGIAAVTATKAKIPVRIKDISEQGISHALKYGYDLLQKRVKRRHMRASDRDKLMALMTATLEYRGVKDADIVVEAVFEDINLKHQMVRDVEANCSDSTVFASNTSSLPIGEIAKAAEHPERVIGLHYFSPVDKMPLAEVIAHEGTSPETIAKTVAFAKKQGKTPIVVKDGAGFYVNRILALYMNEAAQVLLEGTGIAEMDKSVVKFGFPVGPMTLLDEVGIDVGAKIGPILESNLGARFKAPDAFDKLLEDDRKGKKNGRGFYDYKNGKRGAKSVDESVYSVLGLQPSTQTMKKHQLDRCIMQMLNEAARCYDEGIIANARDGDIGAIFGIGFPPFLGGPFRYMDRLGIDQVVTKLQLFELEYGERFAPAQVLVDMAESGKRFYE